MQNAYATGEVCDTPLGEGCLRLDPELEGIMASSRDYDTLLMAWESWRDVQGPNIRSDYQEMVRLQNQGASDYGFENTAELWLAGYDMESGAFLEQVERLWTQIKPLYDQLHCYVRGRLQEHYGEDKVPDNAPIPAHLLGNMWAQTWSGIYDLVVPYPDEPDMDITAALRDQGYDAVQMMELGEDFYTSLGLNPLPDTFWTESLFTRPEDREVVCHASAWDLETSDSGEPDVRIKMCTRVNQEDLFVLHHELGHNFYQLAYGESRGAQPLLYRNGANDGFHEAIGDTVRLSVNTPSHLKRIGLTDVDELTPEGLINYQVGGWVGILLVGFPTCFNCEFCH